LIILLSLYYYNSLFGNFCFMDFLKYISVFSAWFITILILDTIWLWSVVKDFTIREFWNLIIVEEWKIKINLWVWLLAWFIISSMIVVFVTLQFTNYKDVAIYGALLWFMSYAMYDLTNLTFLTNYSLKFTIIDIAWWTFVWMMISLVSFFVLKLFK
jgi:uncharacterized membrane protein